MAGLSYPIGTPQPDQPGISPPDPDPTQQSLDPADAELVRAQAAIQRSRSTMAPPEDMPPDPWIVPTQLWKQVQSQALIRKSGAASVLQDTGDMAFNAQVDANAETAMAQFDPKAGRTSDPTPNLDIYRAAQQVNNSIISRALNAVSQPEGWGVYSPDYKPPPDPANQPTNAITDAGHAVLAGASWLGKGLGSAADGPRFIKHLATRVAVAADTAFSDGAVFNGNHDAADAAYDRMYVDLPRPVQLAVETMSPLNMALAVSGGELATLITKAAPVGLAGLPIRGLAGLLRPIGNQPFWSFPRFVAGGVLSREAYENSDAVYNDAAGLVGYEHTGEAPLAFRLALGGAAAIAGSSPEAVLSKPWQYAKEVWNNPDSAEVLKRTAAAWDNIHAGMSIVDVSGGISDADRAAGVPERYAIPRPYRAPLQPPDVLPYVTPSSAKGIVTPPGMSQGARFAQQNAIDYAADLAGQTGTGQVPPRVAWALQRSQDAIRPNGQFLESAIEHLPLLSDAYEKLFNPSLGMPLNLRQAFWASGATRGEVGVQLAPSRGYYLGRIKELFGGIDTAPLARYIGPAERVGRAGETVPAAEHPWAGKLYDIWQHPDYYDLTDAQRQVITQFDVRNSLASAEIRDGFGAPIGEHTAGGPFIPIVDKAGVRATQQEPEEVIAAMSGRLKERTFATPQDRLADPNFGPTFDPETDFANLFEGLDAAKTQAAAKQAFRWGVGGSTVREGSTDASANAFFETPWGTFVPKAHADALGYLAKDINNGLLNFLEDWRSVRLNGDGSPITNQGALSFFSSPYDTAKQIIGAVADDTADFGNAQGLRERMAADPASWLDFAFYNNIPVARATPEEFSLHLGIGMVGKGIEHAYGPVNTRMWNLLTEASKRDWEEMVASAVRHGATPEEAKAAAADTISKIIPLVANEKLGLSPARQKIERAALTSISFLRQPVAFMSEAAAGYMKLGLKPAGIVSGTAEHWATLSPQERFAAQRFAKLAGSVMGVTTVSAIMSAKDRNLSPWEAAKRNIDPESGDFSRLWLNGSFSVPIGGPFRSLIRAAAPRAGVPFAGIPSFVQGRLNPALSTAEGYVRNQDFFGNKIVTGDFPENILRGIGFAAEQAAPLSVGAGAEAYRTGQSADVGLKNALAQFAGASGNDTSTVENMNIATRGGFDTLFGQGAPDPVALHNLGLSQPQIDATQGVTDLDGLKAKIGTRAANAVSQQAAPDFPAQYQAWVDDLTRRAANGDSAAKASLVQVRLQENLERTAALSTRLLGPPAPGIPEETSAQPQPVTDKVAYRTQRTDIMTRALGESAAYADQIQPSTPNGEIDALTAQWYDLIRQATKPNGNVDNAVFDALEQKFFQEHADKADLIRGNIAATPKAANPLEVELRQTRSALEQAGFWQSDDKVWAAMQSGGSDAVKARLADFPTFAQYRSSIVDKLTENLLRAHWAPSEALVFANANAKVDPIVAVHDQELLAEKAKWAQAHAKDGLAQNAIAWGYLSPSVLNVLAARPSLDDANKIAAGQPTATPAPTTATPPTETANPVPREPNPSDERIVQLWEAGSSYGQIGIRIGKSAGAVEQSLRRYYGGSPDEARKKAAAAP